MIYRCNALEQEGKKIYISCDGACWCHMNFISVPADWFCNITTQLYYWELKHCYATMALCRAATDCLSQTRHPNTHTHTLGVRCGYQWTRITRIMRLIHEWLGCCYIIRAVLAVKSTLPTQSLWMKAAVEARGLLCLIGYSESLCMCNLKIKNSPDAFPFLAAHKKIKSNLSSTSSKHPGASSRRMGLGLRIHTQDIICTRLAKCPSPRINRHSWYM